MHQEAAKHRCLLMSRCTLSLCWSSVTAPAASSLLLWRSNLHPPQLLTLVLTCRRDTGLSFGKAASAPGLLLLLLLPWLFVELLVSGQRLMRSKGLPGTMKP
jgi:hypothetical protein